jgi:hypothetical protein
MNYQDLFDALDQEISGNCDVMQNNPNLDTAKQIHCIMAVKELLMTHKINYNSVLNDDTWHQREASC